MNIARLSGEAFDAALDDLAALRIAVFRAFPYLYDGDAAYERHYLRSYRDNPRAVLIAATEGGRIVGAATAMPLADHADARQMRGPLPPTKTIFYCAESVLLPDYRGRGIGHAFFDHREAEARAQGFAHSLFCSVVRPDTHPLRPDDYRPLDTFWTKRGYAPVAGAEARFSWKDLDAAEETAKTLQCWSRTL